MTLDTPDNLRLSSQSNEMEQDGKVISDTAQKDHAQKSGKNTGVQASRNKAEIYGSFLIDDSEFAILVSAVQEVVNEPTDIAPVPLSPPYMLGLFNLRGMIIPIVDLRILLGYSTIDDKEPRKVAIIEHKEQRIGLLFDKTGEVLSEKNAARVAIRPKNGDIKDVVVEGVLKFNNGDRLVQILDPYELLSLEKLPLADNGSEKSKIKAAKGKRRTCISFQTGSTLCAIDLRYVKEVKEMPAVDQSLLAHDYIIGTTNLRGVISPVIDFCGFIGDDAAFNPDQAIPKNRKMLVIETLEGPVGLMVFSVDNILPYYTDDLLPFARLALPRSEFVKECLIDEDNKIIMMLDQEKLMAEPSLVSAAKSCQEIFPSENISDAEGELASGNARLTFIQFTFERKFVLNTSQVSEVIDRPKELLKPPYSLDFVDGIINLRGELITLINPRLLYGLSSGPEEGQKVLIFKHDSQKYGMLVDSVDEIITTTESNVSELDVRGHPNTARSLTEDIVGCLNHTLPDGNIASTLILDAGALVERCLEATE